MKSVLLLLLISLLIFGFTYAKGDEDGFIGPNLLRADKSLTIYRENQNGIPTYVVGKLSEKIAPGSEEIAAIAFFETNRGAYKMDNPSEELQLFRLDSDQLGMRHLRFHQYYKGLRVIGGELIVHFTSNDYLKTVNGNYEPFIDTDINANLSSSEAIIIAERDLESFFGKGNPDNPELVIFPWEGENYLCWRMFLYSETPMGRWEYFVDANNGEIIFKANRIMNQEAIGTGVGVMGNNYDHIDTYFNGSTYEMNDYTRRANNDIHGHNGLMPASNYIRTYNASSSLPGTIATDADNVWNSTSQAPSVDGHVYTALFYDWLLREMGRNGYNANGASMRTSVNYSAEGNNNAYWNGSQIVIWSWSSGWRSLAGCPDVIAHEWGHAVTEYTSGLVYQKEPGALNESFSDMMGAAFEFAHDSLDTPDWYMGENGMVSGNGFRNMENPHEFGDPDFYGTSDPYWVDVVNCTPSPYNDWCGVHTNSGVGNKWFSLLSDGGFHHNVTVTGISVANAIRVAYRANAYYWTSNTDYHDAAIGTISASDDLDFTGGWTTQVINAWNAVGVSTPVPSLVFDYPLGVPAILVPSQPTTFEVTVSGVYDGEAVAGSGVLYYSIDGGGFVNIPMTVLARDYYEATLPSADCGSQIDFYVSVDEVSSGTIYDPDPNNPFNAIVATGTTIIFEDNFQTNLGWTVSGSVSDGAWERAIPAGGGDRGDPPTDYDGSGYCYVTDNADGNSDVDDGTTTLISPAFDLSGGDARINYARWYSNNFGNDPYNDEMHIYISNDNGSGWTLVETVGPVEQASGGWYENTFWASDYITPTAQMKLRFDASDLNAGSVVEAGVDAVSVTRFECNTSVLQIITVSLPDWTEGETYSQQLDAINGTGVLTWTDKFNDLIGTGLSLSTSGLLSGIPNTSGTISFTAEVTDEDSNTDDQPLTITVNPALLVTTDSLPDWTAGQTYSQQLSATGGTGSHSWSDKDNDLAGTGLTISSTGLLSGTPATDGAYSFTALVTDDIGATAEKPLTVTINPVVSITTDTVPNGRKNLSYSAQIEATGGTGLLTFNDKNSDLSGTGLSLDSVGLLSGIPIDTGTINFTALVEDFTGSADEKAFSIAIGPAFICGDADGSFTEVDIADLVYLVEYMFGDPAGPPPPIMEAADVDNSGGLDVADLVYLVEYMFGVPPGPEPNCPGK